LEQCCLGSSWRPPREEAPTQAPFLDLIDTPDPNNDDQLWSKIGMLWSQLMYSVHGVDFLSGCRLQIYREAMKAAQSLLVFNHISQNAIYEIVSKVDVSAASVNPSLLKRLNTCLTGLISLLFGYHLSLIREIKLSPILDCA
jgi:hypothetical protein